MDSIQEIFEEADYGVKPIKQKFVRDNWDKMAILELAKYVFDNDELDARSPLVKKLKDYITKIKKKPEYVELSETQRDQIEENASSMGPVEIARYIFDNPDLEPLSKECKTVDKYIKIKGWGVTEAGSPNKYQPPKAYSVLIRKVLKSKPDVVLEINSLSDKQKRNLDLLRNCLNSPRFQSTINAIRRDEEKELFESTFIEGVFEKELNSEDLNMYVSLCSDYVLLKQIKKQLDMLNDEIEDSINDEDRQIKMSLTEAFGKKTKEYDDCANRIKQLQQLLAGSRKDRLKGQVEMNHSLTLFVEKWKQEDERKRMILIAKARDLKVKDQMDQIESEEEYIAHVMGISKDEILNG